MSNDLSSKSVVVYDSGLFVHIADCLAKDFGKVYYYSPCDEVMHHMGHSLVGDGFENIERVDQPADLFGKVDCWCFTDVWNGALQNYLRKSNVPVWGHMGGDELELKKGLFLRVLDEIGMNVPPHTKIKGMVALREHLRDKTDKWVKISRFRGDWETLHFRDYVKDKKELDCHEYRLGPMCEHLTFYVFDKLDTEIEDGVDTWCIDGQWPTMVMHAMERKDKSLIGAIQEMQNVHEDVRVVNELFGPVLARYGYRGPFSTEVRMTDQGPFFIDPTCRFGSPPSQLQTVLIRNLPDVIWGGANGEVVEPEFGDEPVGAQALITSDREKDEWLTFQMDKELRPYVKSAFSCEIDGEVQILPNPLENWAGWLVATGKDIKEVVETMKERSAMLPDGFDCDLSSLATLLKELEDAKEQGIEITDEQIPEPAVVLDK